MKKRLLAVLLAVVMVLAMLPTAALAADDVFTIEDGELRSYSSVVGGIKSIPNSIINIEGGEAPNCYAVTEIPINTILNNQNNINNHTEAEIAQKFVDIAMAQRGKTASDLGLSNDWCGFFISWCAKQYAVQYKDDNIDLTEIISPQGNFGSTHYGYAINHGGIGVRFYDHFSEGNVMKLGELLSDRNGFTPQTGDLVLFTYNYNRVTEEREGPYGENIAHVGIVHSVSDDRIKVVHGNWAGRVVGPGDENKYTVSWKITSPEIYGYARPNWAKFTQSSPSMNPTDFDIQNGVLTAYKGPSGAVTIPNDVTSIGDYAFSRSTGLTSVTIPDSVTSIGDCAFSGCTGLTSVAIPSSVTSIECYAFKDCTNLTSVAIPNSVTRIGHSAFSNTPWLKNQGDLVVVNGILLAYQGDGSMITIPNSVTSIGESAFNECGSLTNVTIPNSVSYIGYEAFRGCTSLTSVTIPGSVTSVEAMAFSGCTGLTSVTIGNGVTSIGAGAFMDCTDLTSVTIPNSVTDLWESAFCNCTGLTSVTIPNSVTTIGPGVFMRCIGLTYVNIGNGITHIGGWAFEGCTSLKDIYYNGTEVQWKAIEILDNSDSFISATIHYNSAGPDQPVQPAQKLAYASTQNVLVDGKAVEFQAYALKDEKGNDINYVKLRDVALALSGTAAQFSVKWDQAAQSISVTSGEAYEANGSEMKTPYSGNRAYTVSSSPLYINGKAADLGAILLTDDAGSGYTYFKLRDLGEALGIKVDWSAEKGIFIETK